MLSNVLKTASRSFSSLKLLPNFGFGVGACNDDVSSIQCQSPKIMAKVCHPLAHRQGTMIEQTIPT